VFLNLFNNNNNNNNNQTQDDGHHLLHAPAEAFQFKLAHDRPSGRRAYVEVSVPHFRNVRLGARGTLEVAKITSLVDEC